MGRGENVCRLVRAPQRRGADRGDGQRREDSRRLLRLQDPLLCERIVHTAAGELSCQVGQIFAVAYQIERIHATVPRPAHDEARSVKSSLTPPDARYAVRVAPTANW